MHANGVSALHRSFVTPLTDLLKAELTSQYSYFTDRNALKKCCSAPSVRDGDIEAQLISGRAQPSTSASGALPDSMAFVTLPLPLLSIVFYDGSDVLVFFLLC